MASRGDCTCQMCRFRRERDDALAALEEAVAKFDDAAKIFADAPRLGNPEKQYDTYQDGRASGKAGAFEEAASLLRTHLDRLRGEGEG